MKIKYGPEKSRVEKRSVVIAGRGTSICLENPFWTAVKDIAAGRDMTVSDLVAFINAERRHGNLSSAVRLFVLDFYRNELSHQMSRRDGLRGHSAAEPPSSKCAPEAQ
jgi:predicted DNA-binding ribbon-helix-helix protein